VSLISDGFGDFCFWQEPFRCLNCAPPAWPPELLRDWESGPNIFEDDRRGNGPVGEVEGWVTSPSFEADVGLNSN
jgi:hypothetical protein